jgi:hypothetical protein
MPTQHIYSGAEQMHTDSSQALINQQTESPGESSFKNYRTTHLSSNICHLDFIILNFQRYNIVFAARDNSGNTTSVFPLAN